jgi:hypothetical protein
VSEARRLKAEADALVQQGKQLIEHDLPRATELLNEAVQRYWAAEEYYSAAAQTGNYGWALRRLQRPDLARPYLLQAAELFDRLSLTEYADRHRQAAEDVAADLTPEVLAELPAAVRTALQKGDAAALNFALEQLPTAEQAVVVERLTALGVISIPSDDDDDVARALTQFAPLLAAIAAVARGASAERADVEVALQDLDRKGWRIRRPVEKIWAGERRLNPLTFGLDATDSAMVRRVLELVTAD